MPLHISSNFDSGNIVCTRDVDPGDIRLEIRKDNNSDFYMWFHFRLTGAKDTPCVLQIMNAKDAAYPPPTGRTGSGCRPAMTTAC
jgi:murein tripeptide amidase MpaA